MAYQSCKNLCEECGWRVASCTTENGDRVCENCLYGSDTNSFDDLIKAQEESNE